LCENNKIKYQKILLICEDSEILALALSLKLEGMVYVLVVLAKDNQPTYVLEHIEDFMKKEQPDILIEKAKKINSNIPFVVFIAKPF